MRGEGLGGLGGVGGRRGGTARGHWLQAEGEGEVGRGPVLGTGEEWRRGELAL